MKVWQWYVWRHPVQCARAIRQDYRLAREWERRTGMKP